MTWAAKMAVGLDTGVPWIMCKETDAPDPVVMKLYHVFLSFFGDELCQVVGSVEFRWLMKLC